MVRNILHLLGVILMLITAALLCAVAFTYYGRSITLDQAVNACNILIVTGVIGILLWAMSKLPIKR